MADEVQYDQQGVIFNIQRYSLHDGPGIRTIPFLKGCPLSCQWCCNPESQHPYPEVVYNAMKCIHCGRCVAACPKQAISMENPQHIDRELCNNCGACTEACLVGALEMKGELMSVQQVVDELKKDATHYRRSGGGITLSGGEALMQPDFALELLKACKDRGWHTAMETTGCGASKTTLEKLFKYVDLALMDVKVMDPELHKKYTGRDNHKLLENLRYIASLTEAIVRVPLIPGVNDNEAAIMAIIEFAQSLEQVKAIHLLPYHNYGENKYALLGREYLLADTQSVPEERVDGLKQLVESHHYHCEIGG